MPGGAPSRVRAGDLGVIVATAAAIFIPPPRMLGG